MANSSFLQKLMGYSFHVEMIVRRIYWSKITQVIKNKLSINNSKKRNPIIINLENIKNYLKKIGLKKGDILIVHSERYKVPVEIIITDKISYSSRFKKSLE